MRVRELAELSGVSIPTIKYYIREGLLPPGDRTARTQAHYDETHLRRLQLIKALREGAGVPIATLSRVFAAMKTAGDNVVHEYLRIAVSSLSVPFEVPPGEEGDYAAASELVTGLLAELEWNSDTDSHPAGELVQALVHVRRYLPGLIDGPTDLLPYAHAARTMAEYEIPETYDPTGDPESALRLAVLGTALFEPVLLALRKLAHVDRVRGLSRT